MFIISCASRKIPLAKNNWRKSCASRAPYWRDQGCFFVRRDLPRMTIAVQHGEIEKFKDEVLALREEVTSLHGVLL